MATITTEFGKVDTKRQRFIGFTVCKNKEKSHSIVEKRDFLHIFLR